nr:MAG TPA: hypothetical protein [Caudoviricetes sp.]
MTFFFNILNNLRNFVTISYTYIMYLCKEICLIIITGSL